jgi:protein TonB
MFFLAMMNGTQERQKNNGEKSMTSFHVDTPKKERPKPKIVKRKRPQEKKAPVSPDISSSLLGQSFGLGEFEFLGDATDGLLGDTSNTVMTEDTVDDVPNATYRPPLEYPSYARQRGLNGEVWLKLLIDARGDVEKVAIISSTPEGVFDQTALDSVKQWSFDPAKYKGKPVKVWVKQKISFNLN